MVRISYDGGYAEFMLTPLYTLARIPTELTPEEAAPIMCKGVTTFNALRNSGASHAWISELKTS